MTNQNGTSNLEDNKQVSSHDQDVQTVGMDRTVLNQEEVKKVKSEKKKDSKFSLRELTIIGLLAAITVILGISGYGPIPIGPINVTTLHVPTLIGALVEGPKVGAFVGLIFGVYSFWQNMTAPTLLSPVFINPIISVLPRIIFPVLAWIIYKCIPMKSQGPRFIIAAFLGTVLHTTMVMGLIYIMYADLFANALKMSHENVGIGILTLAVTHGIPEAIFAGVIVTPVALALYKALRKS